MENNNKKEKFKSIKLKAQAKCRICTCGHSKILPFCDESHQKINKEQHTNYKSLKIIPKKDIELEIFSSNRPEK